MEPWEALRDVLLVELKHIQLQLERLEAAYISHVDHCKDQMNEVYTRLRNVETASELAKAFQDECHRQRGIWPHWIYAIAISLGTAITTIAALFGLGMKFH